MKNEILEVLNGLNHKKLERENKLAALANADDSEVIEAKKAELQKEMDEKLSAFVDNIVAERDKETAKITRDLETINELIGEYNNDLIEAEKAEAEQSEESVSSEDDHEDTEPTEESESVQLEVPVEEANYSSLNPFRP